jgi:hypothetical protein
MADAAGGLFLGSHWNANWRNDADFADKSATAVMPALGDRHSTLQLEGKPAVQHGKDFVIRTTRESGCEVVR